MHTDFVQEALKSNTEQEIDIRTRSRVHQPTSRTERVAGGRDTGFIGCWFLRHHWIFPIIIKYPPDVALPVQDLLKSAPFYLHL